MFTIRKGNFLFRFAGEIVKPFTLLLGNDAISFTMNDQYRYGADFSDEAFRIITVVHKETATGIIWLAIEE